MTLFRPNLAIKNGVPKNIITPAIRSFFLRTTNSFPFSRMPLIIFIAITIKGTLIIKVSILSEIVNAPEASSAPFDTPENKEVILPSSLPASKVALTFSAGEINGINIEITSIAINTIIFMNVKIYMKRLEIFCCSFIFFIDH